jgi:glyoxylase-like metal-dependent hydrolase (beta-lactamase superfamily II)
MFYPGLDFSMHPELLDADGTVHIPGGFFVVRSSKSTILVEAGLGPNNNMSYPAGMPPAIAEPGKPVPFLSEGGLLPSALEGAGVKREDVGILFLTHLHADHIGWVAPDGVPYFPNAKVVYGAADWAPLIEAAPQDDPARVGMEAVRALGRTEELSDGTVAVVPGITALHAPGHTPGHYVLVLSSGSERAYLLGDAVLCPLQLTETDITFLSDIDPALAQRTRDTLFREVGDQQAAVGADHFPGLEFQRILRGQGRQWIAL